MKKLIDITDEDIIKVVNRIHPLTENKIIKRRGILGLGFIKSFRKYGDWAVKIELVSNDSVTDGYYATVTKFEIRFHHNSVWFSEFDLDGKASNYNKNHFFGYLKLKELGYELPTEPQWT